MPPTFASRLSLLIILFFFALCSFHCHPSQTPHQSSDSLPNPPDSLSTPTLLPLQNVIYHPRIKTLQCYNSQFPSSPPFFHLQQNDTLHLKFDILRNTFDTLSYTITHCTRTWRPSTLMPYEYLQSINTTPIPPQYHFKNTSLPYTHYQLHFPNPATPIKKSGNYLLKVTSPSTNQVLFTQRFRVVDSQVKLSATIQRPPSPPQKNTSHLINFKVHLGDYKINRPYQNIKPYVFQNRVPDNNLHPSEPDYTQDKTLIYNNKRELLFKGGNEFRQFDFRSSSSHSITSPKKHPPHHVLPIDEPRSYKNYTPQTDQDGHFHVELPSSPQKPAYANVHFRLQFPQPLQEGHIYVFGELTQWRLLPEARLHYKKEEDLYTTTLLLKQGIYDYEYVYVKESPSKIDVGLIEGNSYKTQNSYSIFVYAYSDSLNKEALIGYKNLNSSSLYSP